MWQKLRQKTWLSFVSGSRMVFNTSTSTLTKPFCINLGTYQGSYQCESTAENFQHVNMWDKKDYYPGMLSGGQKQRIAGRPVVCHEPRALCSWTNQRQPLTQRLQTCLRLCKACQRYEHGCRKSTKWASVLAVWLTVSFSGWRSGSVDTTDVDGFFDNPNRTSVISPLLRLPITIPDNVRGRYEVAYDFQKSYVTQLLHA